MRLRSGKITNKEVLIPTRRRYVRMSNPRNTNINEERPPDSIGGDTIITPSTGASFSIISTTYAPSIAQDGEIIPPSIT